MWPDIQVLHELSTDAQADNGANGMALSITNAPNFCRIA